MQSAKSFTTALAFLVKNEMPTNDAVLNSSKDHHVHHGVHHGVHHVLKYESFQLFTLYIEEEK